MKLNQSSPVCFSDIITDQESEGQTDTSCDNRSTFDSEYKPSAEASFNISLGDIEDEFPAIITGAEY
jgi:hypothetical protein